MAESAKATRASLAAKAPSTRAKKGALNTGTLGKRSIPILTRLNARLRALMTRPNVFFKALDSGKALPGKVATSSDGLAKAGLDKPGLAIAFLTGVMAVVIAFLAVN